MAMEKEQTIKSRGHSFPNAGTDFSLSLLSKITLEDWAPGFSGVGWQLGEIQEGSAALRLTGAEGISFSEMQLAGRIHFGLPMSSLACGSA